ncbi:hypothetical protein ACFXKK_36275 [Streptomyces globisporus]|uniref:hypothetical protein n=1 Tax=Streptomyces globisporus TaxID=1908 RepID=UPI00364B8822
MTKLKDAPGRGTPGVGACPSPKHCAASSKPSSTTHLQDDATVLICEWLSPNVNNTEPAAALTGLPS